MTHYGLQQLRTGVLTFDLPKGPHHLNRYIAWAANLKETFTPNKMVGARLNILPDSTGLPVKGIV